MLSASVGGMIAQSFALKYPDMLDRLVLGCTMPSFTHLPPTPEDLATMQSSQTGTLEEGAETMMRLPRAPMLFDVLNLLTQLLDVSLDGERQTSHFEISRLG